MSGNRQKEARKVDSVLLLLDKAPAHTSHVAMTAATEYGFEILPHPPYSMAPSDFYLFPKLKYQLCGIQFGRKECVIKKYLGTGKSLLFRRDKKARTDMG